MDYENLINQPTQELYELRNSLKHVYACLDMADEEDCNVILLDTILLIREHREGRKQQLVQLENQFGPECGRFRDV